MKNLIYYIIPILIAGATLSGRLYWFGIPVETDVFSWRFSGGPASLKSVLQTIAFFIPILLTSVYLIWMWLKHRKGVKYSFIQQVLLVIAIAFFIETFINGIFIAICMGDGGAMLAGYGLTYFLTVPLTLLLSYAWIMINDTPL